ncbi:hypothetical protein L596_002410 [Steinernema carpocapsae]|uniref:Lipid scramblase CLPTM1L n=1 Tax=Steinernema carpocapsae TaxID=34508 RepID=A0A4U8UPF6_STECR|nr:hypothetical protein L596_002410 [Steinernema carpocapsae]
MAVLRGIFGLTSILSFVFAVYVAYSVHSMYQLFHPELCTSDDPLVKCLIPMIKTNSEGEWPPLQLRIYTSVNSDFRKVVSQGHEIHRIAFLDIGESMKKSVKIDIPKHTRNNGSLYVHTFLLPAQYKAVDPLQAEWNIQKSTKISEYRVPNAEAFKLMSDGNEEAASATTRSTKQLRASGTPVTHVRSVLPLTVVAEAPLFLRNNIPGEIYNQLQLFRKNGLIYYWPLFFIDKLSFRERDLVHIKPDTETIELNVQYRPLSIGKARLLISTLFSLEHFRSFGFSDHDLDEVKGIFTDTNFYFLAATIFVAAAHMLFDVLAFKNEISFWKNRKNMTGLSTRGLLWRAFSQCIVFLYLMEEKTSLLVLIPAGISVFVEAWKVTKALRVSVRFQGGLPRFTIRTPSAEEAQTDGFDSEAMHYLIYILIPLCLGGSLYSLVYVPHKSWYNWVVRCAANGVYAFGFLFMLPQLFVNYKLKSVAHLPWRSFMYKAFNTFIDDMFAFIITMPTAHRMACFRDDIVFLIYLYQRYLYPVDKTRANEFGESFEDNKKKKELPVVSEKTKKSKKTQ